ncbi:hypothetical protein CLOLEP_03064 [[Clostridium] leptum DSM 753]|uniref:Uncharacterized protein n=1 Tax=[Clostridium] leptum DSM 753 TaxID=428125 RepID=A7VWU1_9FIRM|nr:hypothetical protein CLOLEP_03064 [[Clostridium] leptum DSM 753]
MDAYRVPGSAFFFCLTACADIGYLFCQRFSSKKEIDIWNSKMKHPGFSLFYYD